MESSNSQNSSTYGDSIKQQGVFGTGVNKGRVENQNISVGVGFNDGTIEADEVAGNVYKAQEKTLAEAAAEIQQLLEQLDKSYPSDTMSGRMQIATEAVSQIENNPALMARVLSALKAGGVSAFEQFLNHPAASFVIGALEDWQKTKED